MGIGPELYGLFLLVITVPAGGLLKLSWAKREKPGGRWLALTLVGMIGWSTSWGLFLLFDQRELSLASLNVLLLSVNVAAIGWVLLTLEFSRQKRYPLRYVLPLFIVPLITQLLAVTNPAHTLLWDPSIVVDANGVSSPDFGQWFFVHAGFNYLLMLVSGILLVNDYLTFDGIYKKQAAVLFAGWVIPVLTSLGFTFGPLQHDYLNPTPVGFLVGAAIWGWGLYRLKLLEIVPVARRRALDEMDEAVIALNEDGLVADFNRAAGSLFEIGSRASGAPIEELLAGYPNVVEAVRGDDDEVTIQRNGNRRHLTVAKTTISGDDSPGGSVIVFKDVSELRRHERDLELLKQVLSRVFRHDISNDLNVIRAHGELLASKMDGTGRDHADTIVRTCDDIIETSRKARAIEKLVDTDRERYEIDLLHVVSQVVEWTEDRFDGASVETDFPSESFVMADEELELAVRCLLDNAVLHNDSEDPWVRVSVENHGDTVTLVVADNGPGIEQNERDVFERRRIDPLSHSSGLGLWTVNWVVRNSRGQAHFEVTDRGTRVALTLDRSHRVASPPRRRS